MGNRFRRILTLVLFFYPFSASLNAAELVISPADRIFVLAPHPDDEVLGCGGVIQQARQVGAPVQVVVLTAGDHLKNPLRRWFGKKRDF